MSKNELSLAQRLSLIQQELKVQKGNFNSFGKYKYRSAEDILEALKPFNKKYDVFFKSEETHDFYSNLPIITVLASIVCVNTLQEITSTAVVGVDLEQKGMQIPQAFGSASSYGKKYAYGNLLLIDDTADADATSTHGKTAAPAAKKQPLKDDQLPKVKEYLKNGGTASKIKEKYSLTKDQEKQLEI